MKMKYISIILLMFILTNCKKKEDEPGAFENTFQFKNQLERKIDILYMHSKSIPHNESWEDTIIFKTNNIEIDITSDAHDFTYVTNPLEFTVVIDYIYYSYKWNCPNAKVSFSRPEYRELIPGGDYLFTFSNLDTINHTFDLLVSEH